jgi:hypothetical protein
MSSQFEHLPLPKINIQLPRRSGGGGGNSEKRKDRDNRGDVFLGQIDQLTKSVAERKSSFHLDPKLIFKIKIADKYRLSEVDLEKSGLTLLAQEPSANKAVVVFSSDAELTELRNRLKSYGGVVAGAQNDYLDAVEELAALEPSDRTGRLLQLEPLTSTELAALDLEFWHTGDRAEMQKYIDQLKADLISRSTPQVSCALTDFYLGDYLCIVRIKVNQEILTELLTEAIVKEIDRRPKVEFEVRSDFNPPLSEIPEVIAPDSNACGILVIDSGVQRGHPLLSPVIGEAEVFPDKKQEFLKSSVDDEADHGTGVAGLAAYGDIEACIRNKSFNPSAWIFSARVLNEHNQFDEDLLVENQLEQAVSYFVNNYPNCKVINLSIGNANQIYQEGDKQTRIAAKIDELAYRYQHKNILFVISSGNYYPYDYRGERDLFRTEYPNYLLEPGARIIDPATSAIAITVGSLSLGRGSMTYPGDAHRNAVAKLTGYPSPFTRTGFGVDGMVKPDFVDFGGDLVLDGDRVSPDNETAVSIVTFSQRYESSLFKIATGSSFAAPQVANLAAQLYTKYPLASSNLIRALMVTSAELPQERPAILQDAPKNATDKQKTTQIKNQLAVYGYGHADLQRAMYSSDNYVILLEDNVNIQVGSFDLFEIPALPPEFLQKKGRRCLSVALAFDPPTRHTRGDSYLGITMEFDLYKGVDKENIINTYVSAKKAQELGDSTAYSELKKEELIKKFGSGSVVNLLPTATIRKKGTLQRGSIEISNQATSYDKCPLYLVVTCNRKWVKVDEIPSQRYALVVSISHSDPEVKLYEQLRPQIRSRLRN